jgi:predicted Ser/Thr protein kinase
MSRRVALDPIRRGVGEIAAGCAETYTVRRESFWWHFEPAADRPLRRQGWKIHVSAAPAHAAETLRRVAGVVVPRAHRWKAARSLDALIELSSPPSPLTQSGKFITIYLDDGEVGDLAAELHAVTAEFDAPVVPSDQRFRPHSNVYLRYGAFSASSVFDGDEQVRKFVLTHPDGHRVEDRRAPGRSAPEWVPDPLPAAAAPVRDRPGTGLFGRDITVHGVLRQSVKGGVFRVVHRGVPAVMKEARIGTTPDRLGRDSRTALHNEWRILRALSGSGLAPEPIAFFHEEDNAYLIQQLLPGRTLRDVVERLNYTAAPDGDALAGLLRGIRRLVGDVEARGVRLHDLTPNNIMVDGDRLAVIDLEHAGLADSPEPRFHAWTPGYVPSTRAGDPLRAADSGYALAAIGHFVLTGIDPYLGRTVDYRDHAGAVLDAFLPADAGPALGAEADEVRARLAAPASLPGDGVVEDAVAAGAELVRLVQWDRHPWPWPDRWAPGSAHPASFMSGTAGIARYYLDLWQATGDSAWLRHTDELLTWTLDAEPLVPGQTPPGLYFGLGSLPWLMTDLAATGHESVPADWWRRQALRLADDLAGTGTRGWDITHGRAGIGLARVALLRATGDETCRAEVAETVRGLLAAVSTQDGVPGWPKDGSSFHGFAHGSAGIATFLLFGGRAIGDRAAVDLAVATGRALLDVATPVAGGRGLSWRHRPDSDTIWSHWCNGAAGVGLLLHALADHTGDPHLLDGARRAGRAITAARPFGSVCRCHGLAGDGDYLLDLAADPRHGEEFRAGAVHIGRKLDALRFIEGFAPKWTSEGLGTPRPDYMRGYTGVHAFRLRLAGHLDRAPLTLPADTEE